MRRESVSEDRTEWMEELQECKRELNLYKRAEKVAAIGTWEYDPHNNKQLYCTENLYQIHGINPCELTLGGITELYEPEHQEVFQKALNTTLNEGKDFNLRLKIRRKTDGGVIWVRTRGEAIENGGVRVIVQDINDSTHKNLDLKKSADLIQNQNERLQNFTQIVSHNLLSHSSNLRSISDFLSSNPDQDERETFVKFLGETTANLEDTLQELHDMIRVQSKIQLKRDKLPLEDCYNRALAVLRNDIRSTQATIDTDFQIPDIIHVRTYLDSIIQNLVSNSIKYRHPDRKPKISIRSCTNEKGKTCLEVEDNGRGMDMAKVGDKLFNLYKTFHHHPEARGIGLFITLNQVEALGGSIEVESEPGKGSIFRVIFNS